MSKVKSAFFPFRYAFFHAPMAAMPAVPQPSAEPNAESPSAATAPNLANVVIVS